MVLQQPVATRHWNLRLPPRLSAGVLHDPPLAALQELITDAFTPIKLTMSVLYQVSE